MKRRNKSPRTKKIIQQISILSLLSQFTCIEFYVPYFYLYMRLPPNVNKEGKLQEKDNQIISIEGEKWESKKEKNRYNRYKKDLIILGKLNTTGKKEETRKKEANPIKKFWRGET